MKRYLICVIAVILLPVCSLAQTGLPPFGSLDQMGLEMGNNQNLNVVLMIPIASSPGRRMDLNFNIVYNSLNWAPGGGAWNPAFTTNPNAQWGWQINLSGGQTNFKTTSTQGTCGHIAGNTELTYITENNQYQYVDPYGTAHQFSVWWKDVYSQCTGQDTYTGVFTGYVDGYYISISGTTGSIISVLGPGGINVTNPGTIVDTNGNYMSSSNVGGGETDWTDSAGRLALKVITGSSSIQYKVLAPTPANTYETTTLNLQSLPVKTNFSCSGVIEYTGTASVPQSLVLPNGQSYAFTYEPTPGNSSYSTARLQRVTLPTGGYHEFDYTGSNDGINCADGTTLGMNRVLNDGTNTATWNYVRNTTNLTTTITTPKLADTPQANDVVVAFNSSGQETSRKIYANSPGTGTPLRTINTTWASNGTPATQVTILDDGTTQSEIATTYDSNDNLDTLSEYNFGSGAPGSLFRTTTYTYQTSTNYTNLNIWNLVTSKQIQNGSGTVQYLQNITYDGVALLSSNCETGALQHNDAGYPCSFNYRGNPTSITTYLAPATQGNPITKNFTYDWFGNLITAQLNCCQNKTWVYSSATQYSQPDSVTSGTSPTTLTTSYAYYFPTGQVNTITDPNNLVTTYQYDAYRRLTSATQSNGATNGENITISYNDSNFTSTTTTAVNSSSSVKQITTLDGLGRPSLSTTEDVSNNVYSKVSVLYDLIGRAYQTSNPYTGTSASYWSTTALDVLGRPVTITLQDNSATSFTYITNTATLKDPAGNLRESVTDAAGRLTTILEPDPSNNNSLTLSTTNTYSILDELTQVAQGSQTRAYVYDALGRLQSTTTPEEGMVCFGTVSAGSCQPNTGYDQFDDILYRTDARGVVTSYGYDTLNRLKSVSYNVGTTGVPATSTVSFTYGASASSYNNGRLITMTDGVGSENYTYNSLGQMTQLQKVINSTTYTTTYAFNLAGELTQITYPSNRIVQQSVDAIGRLCEVAPSTNACGSATSPFATGLGYDDANHMTGLKYGNGIYASFGFSSDRLQLNCLDYSTTNRSGSCTHDATTKFGLTYSYAPAGSNNGLYSSIADYVDNGRTASYTYDALYRLTTASTPGSANYPAWGLSETYDRYGNRSAQTAISGCVSPMTCPQPSATISATTNRLVGSPYSYDSSGNMTDDGINTLVYDAENHAVSATNGSNAGAYVYDGNGLRVQKCVPNCISPTTATIYVFSGSKVIAEYDNGAAVGSPSREYIYAGAALITKIDSSGTKYYQQDHRSNRLVTSSSGTTLEQMGTFPFGESWYNASSDELLFSSYERDAESGNDYAQARYNVSGLARFSSPDPIAGSTSDPQSLNRYSYVRNMPVMLTDPAGLTPQCNTVKTHGSQPNEASDGGGPHTTESESDLANPEPRQQGSACNQSPWYDTIGGGGMDPFFGLGGGVGYLDGGYNGDDSGTGMGSPIGGGGAAGAAGLVAMALTPTIDCSDPSMWDYCGANGLQTTYGNSGLLDLLSQAPDLGLPPILLNPPDISALLGPPKQPVNPCVLAILSLLNQYVPGANLAPGNVQSPPPIPGQVNISPNNSNGVFTYNGAINIYVASPQPLQISPGQRWGPSTGASLHVPKPQSFFDPYAVFASAGGNMWFTAHIDSANANANPLGFLKHAFTDVLGQNSRNPCPGVL
jgi:RHS repeat-associated protein